MRALFALLVLFASASVSAQATDSLPPLPPLSFPIQGEFQPLHASAERAFLYSIGTTAGLAGLAYTLYLIVPEGDGAASSGKTAQEILAGTPAILALFGTGVGNFTLGAVDDIERSMWIRAYGMAGGLGTLAVAGLVCLSGSDRCETVGRPLAILGIGVFGGGLVGAMAYDLATIPRNASRAQRRRPVAVVGLGMQEGSPTLALRVGL